MVLDTSDYVSRINNVLSDSNTYAPLKSDLAGNIERQLNKFIYMLFTKNRISQQTYRYFHSTNSIAPRISQQTYRYFHSTDSIAPRIYGLPKIHKTDFSFRPIVYLIYSPLYNLSKFIAVLLTPLIGAHGFTLKNSYEFVGQLKNWTISRDECMIWFGVISLFTKVPVDVAKTVVLERLKKDDTLDNRCDLTLTDIITSLNLCLDNTYLYFRGKFYRQILCRNGLTHFCQNCKFSDGEYRERSNVNFFKPPKFWRRYVDDTFANIKKTEVDKFHKHNNGIEASIKYTIEHETNNSISFLDVCVTRKASGESMTTIYKKLTHTNRLLYFNSVHFMSQKQGFVKFF